MNPEVYAVIEEDLCVIREVIRDFQEYRFSEELNQRMLELGINSSELGRRCIVSHTTIDKWRSGKATPNGKERYKELGMAIGYGEEELNRFLLKNGYPKLYVKNPLDGAARILLVKWKVRADIVELYRKLTAQIPVRKINRRSEVQEKRSTWMSIDFHQAIDDSISSMWFENNQFFFNCDDKTQQAGIRLSEFICCFLDEAGIHEMAVTGELPVTLKPLLYQVLSGKAISVRNLREKLIAYGLYANMTEEEIDYMLDCMKLRLISEPESRLDWMILSALRSAHERYPYFEYENALLVKQRLPDIGADEELKNRYEEKIPLLEGLTEYYDKRARAAEEILFERNYTGLSDKGIMDYVRDILTALNEEGLLANEEAEGMIQLLTRAGDADPAGE